MFKEVADIKTSDQLHLPVPEAKFETVVVQAFRASAGDGGGAFGTGSGCAFRCGRPIGR
jgi:hypothetical protein